MNTRNYTVYRYLNSNGEVIYVGLTSRPLKQRVYEHSVEELEKETAKIQFILLPNESQMHQYEWYFIDLYKPKYNKRDKHDGIPEINTKYDGKWVDYASDGDEKQLQDITDLLRDNVFKGTKLKFKTCATDTYHTYLGGISKEKIFDKTGNEVKLILINRKDFWNNDKRFLIDILSQMAQYVAIENGVKPASNNSFYYRKQMAKEIEKYGVITEERKTNTGKSSYGRMPVNCDTKITDMFSNFEFGKANVEVYVSKNNRSWNRPTSTRKMICPKCGRSTRDTRKDNLHICGNCYKDFGEIIYYILAE